MKMITHKMICFSRSKRRLPSYGSVKYFRNGQYLSVDCFSSSGTRKGAIISNHSTPNNNHTTIICGDFNLREIIWDSPDQTAGSDEFQFTELLNDYFLSQVNLQPTRGENILDLIITSVPDQVKVSNILLPQDSGIVTDHNCIVLQVKANVKILSKLNRHVYDYQKGDFQGLRSTLQNIDLSNIVESGTNVINEAWLEWKEKFVAAVREFIPTRKIKGKHSTPWITGIFQV